MKKKLNGALLGVTGEEIYIGGYILRNEQDGTFWIIDAETQEGGEFSEKEFTKMIAQFWKEHF